MKMSILLIVCTCLMACGKKDSFPPYQPPVTPPVTVTYTLPSQYGTPFSQVTDRQDAVIYQVNIRAFSPQGNLAGVSARLDSIKALGVNVIYLMPIYPVGTLKSVNSPYCIKEDTLVNPEFGTLADLRTLVDGAHSRNMSVMLDWIGNHTAWDHPWITSHKDWYLQDAGGNIISPPGMGWSDVAQLNFANAAMRLAQISAMQYWVYAANIDGYRCDYADGPPADFWKQAIDTLRRISTHKLLLLAEGSRSANFTAGFDFNFGMGFFGQLENIYSSNRTALTIDSLNQVEYNNAANGQQVVRYTTNHDVNSSDGTPLELFGGESGSMAAFTIVALMKSVPMIYSGQEVGMASRLTFPFTSVKIDWSKNAAVTNAYKKVLTVRNNSDAIRRGVLTAYSSSDVCAFTKTLAAEKVFVVVNLRNAQVHYSVPASLVSNDWKNLSDGSAVAVGADILLQPYECKMLKLL